MSTSLKEIEKHFRPLAVQDAKNIKIRVNLDSIGAIAGEDIVTIAGTPDELNRVLVRGSSISDNNAPPWVRIATRVLPIYNTAA